MSLYDDLNVDRGTDSSELKKAYKRKASKCHPDKGGDVEEFKRIQKAYSVLSDPEKKKRYDETGQTNNVPNSHMVAVQTLGGLFLQVSEQNQFTHKNYIPQVRAILANSLTTDKNTLSQLQKTYDNVLYLSEHIQGDSALGKLFDNKASNIVLQKNKCSEHMLILDEAILIIDRCTYSGEEITELPPMSGFGWHTTGA